jgi:hypothetical protein
MDTTRPCALHPHHVANRTALPLRKRTRRPCDGCGKPTSAAAGRCVPCYKRLGRLCTLCGRPTGSLARSRCPAHVVIHVCPVCGELTAGECDGCAVCAVLLGWVHVPHRPASRPIPPGAPCALCSAVAQEAHHTVYYPPRVTYLCRRCHRVIHAHALTRSPVARSCTRAGQGKRISARLSKRARGG